MNTSSQPCSDRLCQAVVWAEIGNLTLRTSIVVRHGLHERHAVWETSLGVAVGEVPVIRVIIVEILALGGGDEGGDAGGMTTVAVVQPMGNTQSLFAPRSRVGPLLALRRCVG